MRNTLILSALIFLISYLALIGASSNDIIINHNTNKKSANKYPLSDKQENEEKHIQQQIPNTESTLLLDQEYFPISNSEHYKVNKLEGLDNYIKNEERNIKNTRSRLKEKKRKLNYLKRLQQKKYLSSNKRLKFSDTLERKRRSLADEEYEDGPDEEEENGSGSGNLYEELPNEISVDKVTEDLDENFVQDQLHNLSHYGGK